RVGLFPAASLCYGSARLNGIGGDRPATGRRDPLPRPTRTRPPEPRLFRRQDRARPDPGTDTVRPHGRRSGGAAVMRKDALLVLVAPLLAAFYLAAAPQHLGAG